jgi:hypothetical protein
MKNSKLFQLVTLVERMRHRLDLASGPDYTGHLTVCIRPDDFVAVMKERYPEEKRGREYLLSCDFYVFGTQVIHHPGASELGDE